MRSHAPRGSARRRGIGPIVTVLIVLYIVANTGARWAVEALWFQELGQLSVLWTRLGTQVLLGVLGALVAFAGLAANFLTAVRRSPLHAGMQGELHPQLLLLESRFPKLLLLASAFLSVALGTALAAAWMPLQSFLHRVPFGDSEPIFGKDVGFYLFVLPLGRAVLSWILGLTALAGIGTAGLYFLRGGLLGPRGLQPRALRHLGILGAVLLVLVALHFSLAQYEVLLSPEGVVFGAGYSDVHARLPGVRVLLAASIVAAAFLVRGAWRGRTPEVVLPPALLLALYGLAAVLVPAGLQKLVVEPNELAREKPFIENSIRLTRAAYDLESIDERAFATNDVLDPATLRQQPTLVENIRLWDWQPLLATYSQIQEIRLYYNFGDVDIDRYWLDGTYRQVMLSARELAYDQIPEGARTWVNLHLKYTHGYGLVMSPVNRITKEGLPELYIRDIPPESRVDVAVTRPEIYFGEQTNTFALVGTTTDEFDYPLGDTNAMTRYTGRGGISIGSLPRRLLFAWYLRSRELLLTTYLSSESRILLRRNLQERVARLAPFLRYDGDPYVVIHEGRLFWIQDAYTWSDRFPYSQPHGGLNYIRNAVKVVVDAYEGTTTFYVNDDDDPLLRVYRSIFPNLFQPLDTMPAGLRDHLRYPEDLFQIQAQAFVTYHMQDPQVFYNREDLWQIPVETVGGREVLVEPYYTIMRLPDSEDAELILMLPFTPARKDNMIAWIAARCDGEHLGDRFVYLFPKKELVYGPRQIEARIDQDAVISQQLTLWNQRGSNVIRGNLLVIPIAGSILYVEPLYLQADKGALPELKRVILAHGDRIEMAQDLASTLDALIGPGAVAQPGSANPPAADAPAAATVLREAARALEILQAAERAVQQGDWTGYGREMQRLRGYLQDQAVRPAGDGTGKAPR